MKCPYCHEELGDDPGVFCDFCGKSLKPETDVKPAMEPSEPQEDTLMDLADSTAVQDAEKTASPSEPLILNGTLNDSRRPFNLNAMADSMLQGDDAPQDAMNRYFSVWYANNRFLLAGGQMLLDLKVKMKDPSVRNMRICFMTVIGKKTHLKKVACDELAYGGEAELSVSFYVEDKTINGQTLLTFFFMFDSSEGPKSYKMDVRATIFARGQSVQSIVMNLQADGGSVNDLSGIHSLEGICKSGDELLERAQSAQRCVTRYMSWSSCHRMFATC